MPDQPFLPPIEAPSRQEIDALSGPVLLQFGTDWCGHCRRAQPVVAAALAEHPGVRHLKIEDGSGRRQGRSFGVTLWPTLVFLRDGQEVSRLVRPTEAEPVRLGLQGIVPAAPPSVT